MVATHTIEEEKNMK